MPGHPTIWIIVGQGPAALAVGAGGGCLDIFTLIYPFFPHSPSLWETARYRLKYCLKGPLNPKQPTNQIQIRRVNGDNFAYYSFNHTALRKAKTLWSFGLSECNRVKACCDPPIEPSR